MKVELSVRVTPESALLDQGLQWQLDIFLDLREERLRCSVAFLVEDEPENEYLSSTHNSLSIIHLRMLKFSS